MSLLRRTLRMVLAVGGPLHGRYLPDGSASLITRANPPSRVVADFNAPYEIDPPDPPTITYHRRRMVIPGWRIALTVYTTWAIDGPMPDGIVLPGFVTGVPGERCRIDERTLA